jgi:hypothetical protein
VSLARDLLAEAMRGGWPMPNADLVAFFAELRDALLVDGKTASLAQLVEVLTQAGASELRDQMMTGFGDGRTLDMLLAGVPEDSDVLPAELARFLPLLGVPAALDRLATRPSEGRRRLLVKIIVARLPREASTVVARLETLDPVSIRELAEPLVARSPERSAEVARLLLSQRDEALRGAAGGGAGAGNHPAPPGVRLAEGPLGAGPRPRRRGPRPARRRLDGGRPRRHVRVRSGNVLGRRGGGGARPGGAPGLGAIPGAEAEAAIRALADKSDGELRRHCLTTLLRRRKGA